MRLHAQFIQGARGRIFAVTRRPTGGAGGCVLIVPPFAEELNKSRPLLAQLMRQLQDRGIASVLPDLSGTADSAGEFREADWDVWRQDIALTAAWMAAEGWPVTMLVGVRLGCALAAQMAVDSGAMIRRTVFWQPVLDGRRFLAQFLRLRVAASLMEDRKETVEDLARRLRAGQTLEVAGYELSSGLARQMEAIDLIPLLRAPLGRLFWMEVVRDAQAGIGLPSQQTIAAVRPEFLPIETCAVAGPPFWSTAELVILPELLSRTVEVLSEAA